MAARADGEHRVEEEGASRPLGVGRRGARRAAAWWLAAGLAACTGPSSETGEPAEARTTRVLVLGIDGLRPDALEAADTPNLDALFPASCRTLDGRTHATGETLLSGPGWASILTGVEPEDHGVQGNDDLLAIDRTRASFLERARDAGHATAAVVHWLGTVTLFGGAAVDDLDVGDDAGVDAQLAARVAAGAHTVLFAHFDDVDGAGHGAGFHPDVRAYVEAIERTDGHLAATVAALEARRDQDRWWVALVTDHGGVGTDHTPRVPETERVPLAFCALDGAPVAIPARPTHMDAATSALDVLGVAHEGLDGTSWVP